MNIRSAALGATVASILAPVFEDQTGAFVAQIVSDQVKQQAWGAAFIYLVGVVLVILLMLPLIWLAQQAWQKAFRNLPFLRQLKFGDRYIEGWWIDNVLAQGSDPNAARAAVKITYGDDGSPSVFGIAYAETTRRIYTFSSRIVQCNDRDVEFIYDVTGPDIPGGRAHGYARYTFPVGVGMPVTYQGLFVDAGRPAPSNVNGNKITDKALIKALNDSDGKAIVNYRG